MVALFASDLDDTLLYRIPVPSALETIIDTPRTGAPIGMTRAAHALLERINVQGQFVPVTARAQVTYERIAMPGGTPAWAAVAAGGVLLHHGAVDAQWQEKLAERAGQAAPLADMERLLTAAGGLGEARVIDGAYVLADILDAPAFAGERGPIEREATAGGWGASVQHGKVHLFPEHVSKAAAVAEVRERSGAPWVAAAGDSLMDAQMLLEADRGLRPGAGELHDLGWRAPHVGVVDRAGTAAGEIVLDVVTRWLTRQETLLVSRRAEEGTGFPW